MLSPKIGASYLASSRIRVLGSLARGFRGPVGVIGDPSRPLVTAWAGEVGVEYDGGPLQLAASFFQFNTANERIRDPVSLDILATGTSRRRGISGSATWQISRRLLVLASGTLNDATITGAADPVDVVLDLGSLRPPRPNFHTEPLAPGDPVPGVSDFFGRVGAQFLPADGWSTYLLARFTGPYTPIGEPGITTQAYAVVDAGGSVALSDGTSIDVDLLNVFDTTYPEIRASGYINPGAPRSLLLSVRFLRPN
jgi:outer membrane receptor protein involved in Fe transport